MFSFALIFPEAMKTAHVDYNGSVPAGAYGYVVASDRSGITVYPQSAVSRTTTVAITAFGC